MLYPINCFESRFAIAPRNIFSLPVSLKSLSKNPFTLSICIGIGGVKEVDSCFNCSVDDLKRFLLTGGITEIHHPRTKEYIFKPDLPRRLYSTFLLNGTFSRFLFKYFPPKPYYEAFIEGRLADEHPHNEQKQNQGNRPGEEGQETSL